MFQFVIVGSNPGSKFDEAFKLGHARLTELDFLELLSKNSNEELNKLTREYKELRKIRKAYEDRGL